MEDVGIFEVFTLITTIAFLKGVLDVAFAF